MKLKTILPIALILLCLNLTYAQNDFSISPTVFEESLIGDSISSNQIALKSIMQNTSNTGSTMHVEIEWLLLDSNLPEGWKISVQDNEVHWSYAVTSSPSPFMIEADQDNATFYVYIHPNEISGCGTFNISYRDFATQEIIQTVGYSVAVDDENCLSVSTRQEVIPSFSISPNPSSGVVNLSTIEDIQSVEVFDITGKLLKSINQVTSPTVDLRAYVDGTYLLRVSDTQNRVSNIRVVKGE